MNASENSGTAPDSATGASNSSGTVAVPTNEQNPLLQRLTPKQFNASVNFYEGDKDLTVHDREQIANDLGKVVTRTAVGSYLSGFLGFFALTGYKRLVNPKRGLSISPDPLRPGRFVHQPFLSFLIGLTTMIATNEVSGRYQFHNKLEQLQQDLRKQNQYRVWQAMDHHQASLFFLYYKRSSEDPSVILKDPRKFTEKSLHEVQYRPPKPKSNANSVLGRQDDSRQIENPDTKELTHWEQIRIANGFTVNPTNTNTSTSSTGPDESDEANSETSESTSTGTSWDRIRQNNKKL